MNACLDAADELLKFENDEATKLNGRYSEYTIQQHGNRQQRRNYNKQHGKKQNKEMLLITVMATGSML